ncbi:MAG: hypothetical protein K5764_06760 [Prevotella sp.]|nr:hypothetical protein [Prevotella sp.]
MNKKTITLWALLLLFVTGVRASNTVVWEGTQKYSDWGDVLNIDGSKFSNAKADDILLFSITASSGAQLQVSYGSSWTSFEGLDCLGITGNYQMVLTSQTVSQLQQGIHIKGVKYTLTALTIVSNDGEYKTENALFAWDYLLTSGATKGQTCTIGLKAYGGAGWYWPETVDMSSYGAIVLELLQPAAETMTVQLLYGEKGVSRKNISKGSQKCQVSITPACKDVWSVNFVSEKAQTVTLASVNMTDKQGNIVPSAVEAIAAGSRILSLEYYNLAGERLNGPQQGVNIVKTNLQGGRSIVRKILK